VVVIEGFRNEPFPKLEVRRDGAASRIPLAPKIPQVVAVASDRPKQEPDGLPTFHIDDVKGVADFVVAYLKLEAR
jgi:molybdopterin-guanine dinucleotide biosynthesis protein B